MSESGQEAPAGGRLVKEGIAHFIEPSGYAVSPEIAEKIKNHPYVHPMQDGLVHRFHRAVKSDGFHDAPPTSARMTFSRVLASMRGVFGQRHEPPPRMFSGAFAKRLDPIFPRADYCFRLQFSGGSRALRYFDPKALFGSGFAHGPGIAPNNKFAVALAVQICVRIFGSAVVRPRRGSLQQLTRSVIWFIAIFPICPVPLLTVPGFSFPARASN